MDINSEDFYWVARENPVQSLSKEVLADENGFRIAYKKCDTYYDYCYLLQNSPIDLLDEVIEDIVVYEHASLEDVPEPLLNNYIVAQHFAKKDIDNMHFLPMSFRDDEDFINGVSHSNGKILSFATSRIRNIDYICENCVAQDPNAIEYVPIHLRSRNICLNSILIFNAKNWKYIPDSFANDKGFVLEAGAKNFEVYQYLSPIMKEDREITAYFVNRSGVNLQYAPEQFKNNPEIVKSSWQGQSFGASNFQFASETIRNDENFIKEIIQTVPKLIHFAGEKIKDNVEVAKIACQYVTTPPVISFFNENVINNPEVAMIAVKNDFESMKFLKKLKSDKNFVMSYINHSKFKSDSLHYISDELKNDIDLMHLAYQCDSKSINAVGEDLMYKKTFLKLIFNSNNHYTTTLNNLKQLPITIGDESVLLYCLDSLPKNQVNKFTVLQYIENEELKKDLQQHSDIYSYIQSCVLHSHLEQTINQKPLKEQKKKI